MAQVTVFIPTFNRLPLLQRAVHSVLSCGAPVKVHVLDNASTDGTREWLESAKIRGNKAISVTVHPTNIGAVANFQAGFDAIDTQYYVPLADDDELVPGFLPDAIKIADDQQDVVAVVGARAFRDGSGWRPGWPSERQVGRVTAEQHVHDFLRFGHYVTWSAILWRADVSMPSVTFRDAARFGLPSDVYFQFLVFSRGPAYLYPRPAATFSVSQGQASSQIGLNGKSFEEHARLAHAIKCSVGELLDITDEALLHELVRPTINRWLRFMAGNRARAANELDESNLADSIQAYASGLLQLSSPYEFPFMAEILARQSVGQRKRALVVRAVRRALAVIRRYVP